MEAERIKELIHRHLNGSDVFLVSLNLTRGKLAVYVDRLGGIGISECSALNRFLRDEPELMNFTEQHEIEVSSPGPDVPLKDYRQYVTRIGKNVRIVLPDGSEKAGKMINADQAGFELVESANGKKRKTAKEDIAQRFGYSEIKEALVEFKL